MSDTAEHPGLSAADRETAVIDAFVDLSHGLTTENDVAELLARLVERCVELLGASAAGVLLPDVNGTLAVLAASSSEQDVLENFQLQSAEGPCLDAIRTGEPVLVHDLDAVADRWPIWAPRALSNGVRSAYGLPMSSRGRTLGALNLFGSRTDLVTDRNQRLGIAFADVATVAVLTSRDTRAGDELTRHLQGALESRIVIEQAKGVVGTALGTSMDDAFAVIRRHSRSANRRLSEVARDLAEGRLGADELHR